MKTSPENECRVEIRENRSRTNKKKKKAKINLKQLLLVLFFYMGRCFVAGRSFSTFFQTRRTNKCDMETLNYCKEGTRSFCCLLKIAKDGVEVFLIVYVFNCESCLLLLENLEFMIF